jgi:hypothetical protein
MPNRVNVTIASRAHENSLEKSTENVGDSATGTKAVGGLSTGAGSEEDSVAGSGTTGDSAAGAETVDDFTTGGGAAEGSVAGAWVVGGSTEGT